MVKKCLNNVKKGYVPIVTSGNQGHPGNSSINRRKTVTSVIRSAGKLHTVYISSDDQTYTMAAAFYRSQLASRFANYMTNRAETSFAMVCSVTSRSMFRNGPYNRNKLDNHGHHYLTTT